MEGTMHEETDKKEKKYGPYEDYEIEDAARTLLEADKIKKDKEKMKYVAMCMKEKAQAYGEILNSTDDMRALAKKKAKEESGY